MHSEADLWECILEELEKSAINAKINIFYMLDSLLDQSLAMGVESYRELVKNDLEKVVHLTVPKDTREGVLNRMSTLQVSDWNRDAAPCAHLTSMLVAGLAQLADTTGLSHVVAGVVNTPTQGAALSHEHIIVTADLLPQ